MKVSDSSVKESIERIARSLGFQRTVIGALRPMEAEREHFESWLQRGYHAEMEYMKRNAELRTSPGDLHSGARSVVIVSVSYYNDRPPPPAPFFGSIARYAVGLDYHAVIRRKLRELRDELASQLSLTVTGKSHTDSVALYEQGLSSRHGLGFAGKNTLIIGPKLSGTYNFIGELFLDIELEADGPYEGTCGNCFRCGAACPTDAIVEPGFVDANRCISYLTIENRGPIARELRPRMGDWVFGCDICQEVCPYNQRPPQTPWNEFRPESGAGHYLDLRGMLAIRSQDDFHARFGHTPLRRPKRVGILRNALVVLGNQVRECVNKSDAKSSDLLADVLEELVEFCRIEEDPMLREHASWAISQANNSFGRAALMRILDTEKDEQTHREIEFSLLSMG